MILNRLFLSEEYKQYLTFSVEISTNTLITQSAISQRKLLNGSQKRGFLLPEITKAREDFESKVGSKIKWT